MTLVQLTPSKIMFLWNVLNKTSVEYYLTAWMPVSRVSPNTRFGTKNAFWGLFLLSVGGILLGK
jgi:hypothetical protein